MGTNLDKWRNYQRDCVAPDSYINMSFYFMINAALQRRVWLGDRMAPIFPNIYLVLVGEPSVGKGRAISPTIDILRHWPFEPPGLLGEVRGIKGEALSQKQVEKSTIKAEAVSMEEFQSMKQTISAMADDALKKTKSGDTEDSGLIPVGADAITYEALMRHLATTRRIANYRYTDENGKTHSICETHASIAFCLEEMSSLFRKHSEEVVQFLLKAYDCSDYKYQTKGQGTDYIKRCCVSLLAGTTPNFLRRIFNDDLITEGFASRTWFVYETSNRFQRFFISKYEMDQLRDRMDILNHIYNLAHLNGQVSFAPDAWHYIKHWFETIHPYQRANNSVKLSHYYGRKNLHVAKLAMAVHFADSLDMVIERASVEKAITILDDLEGRMHSALSLDSKNPLASIAKDIIRFLKAGGPQTFNEILIEFYGSGREAEIKETLEFLVRTKKVAMTNKALDDKTTARAFFAN